MITTRLEKLASAVREAHNTRDNGSRLRAPQNPSKPEAEKFEGFRVVPNRTPRSRETRVSRTAVSDRCIYYRLGVQQERDAINP